MHSVLQDGQYVRGTTLPSITDNHNELMSLWERSLSITNDTEMKGRIIGAQTNMKKFSFLFGSLLGEKVLMQTDNLSRSLQSPELSAIEAHQLAEAVIGSFQQERKEATFNSFWDTVCNKRDELDISRENFQEKENIQGILLISLGMCKHLNKNSAYPKICTELSISNVTIL